MADFQLESNFEPRGDQPEAIAQLVQGLEKQLPRQVLKGITGSGKTFTMANVIAHVQRPTLVLAPNKTLAAQLYREFKELFPQNAVEYFVSYYDYYQPEAYVPSSDTYIDKDVAINDQLDRMRLAATKSLLERRDAIIVASISCIYGIGSPHDFNKMVVYLRQGDRVSRQQLLHNLVEIQYTRNDLDFHSGVFRVRGEYIDIFPAYEEKRAVRVQLFGDEIESLSEIDTLTGKQLRPLRDAAIYPSTLYVTDSENRERALKSIEAELQERLVELKQENKLVEAQRLEFRTNYDLELMREVGVCSGIENYSRHLTNRRPGEAPFTLLDYFPDDWLMFIDESHIATPQARAMYKGDRSRKETLVDFGFRLPSALDNRPLKFEEFRERLNQVIYCSATPAALELEDAQGIVVEQVVRPTGLMDPPIEVRPATGQVEDLVGEIRQVIKDGYRVLVTTLTKRIAEELNEYLGELNVKSRYIHSDVDTIERTALMRDLRSGKFDVLVGINLLREGLDLPEVSLVAILDADKEGLMRSEVSLIQTCGRAARNVDGRVIMYGDNITRSMQATIDETNHRRTKQQAYNEARGLTPESVRKAIGDILDTVYEKDYIDLTRSGLAGDKGPAGSMLSRKQLLLEIKKARKEMLAAAEELRYEEAARFRDRLGDLETLLLDSNA